MTTATDRGLACPRCGCEHTQVIRTVDGVRKRRRRRRCRNCGGEFHTAERLEGLVSGPEDQKGADLRETSPEDR